MLKLILSNISMSLFPIIGFTAVSDWWFITYYIGEVVFIEKASINMLILVESYRNYTV